MPELPDIEVYCHCLKRRVTGIRLVRVRVVSPFLLRSVAPPVEALEGRILRDIRRLHKKLVLELDDRYFLVLHLMIAGRLQWKPPGARPAGRITSAILDFENGRLLITEAGPKKRAALYLAQGEDALAAHHPGGLEPLDADYESFRRVILRGNHTLKRVLTDPRSFSGIGNAFSDEILHAARLSPVTLTSRLDDDEHRRLFHAMQHVLREWTRRLIEQFRDTFPAPGEITAFRPDFAVHGRFGKFCPDCGTTVQRIRYADNETNYCPRCQTGGKLLADRSLSRLLKSDWPKNIEELEAE